MSLCGHVVGMSSGCLCRCGHLSCIWVCLRPCPLRVTYDVVFIVVCPMLNVSSYICCGRI